MLPAGVSTQSDANRVVLAHLDTIFDEVGEIGDLHTKGNVQAADFLDSEGNSIIGGGEAENPFDMDAVGTATQKITLPEGALDNPGEEADIGVGHIYEVGSDFGDFTYYFKKEGLENIHGNVGDEVYENPFYWMTGDWGNFYWGGESMGSEFHSAVESFISALETDTIVIGEEPDAGRSASLSGVKDKKAKMDALRARSGFSVKASEPTVGGTPLVVHGKIQARDLVDAEGNSLLGGGDDPNLEAVWEGYGESAEDGSERGAWNFYLKGVGQDNPYLPDPQFQYVHGEEYTIANFNNVNADSVHADSVRFKRSTTNVTQNLIQYTHGMIEIGTLDDFVDVDIPEADMNAAFKVMKMKDGENQPTLQIKKDGKLWNKGIDSREHIIGNAIRPTSELNFKNTVITQGGRLVDYNGNFQSIKDDMEGEREEIANPYYYLKTVDGEQVYTWKFNIPVQAPDYLDAEGNSIIGADDLKISYDSESGWEFERNGGGFPVITFSTTGHARFDRSVTATSFTAADGGYFSGADANFSGEVRAAKFVDADGNSIIGQVDGLINDDSMENVFVGSLHPDSPTRGNYLTTVGHLNKVDRMGGTAVGWSANAAGDQGATAIGLEAQAQHLSPTAIGARARANNNSAIALGVDAQTTKDFEFAISPKIESVNFSSAIVQASDFIDADGNSIIGGGGGGSQELPEGFTRDEGLPSDKFSRGIVLGGVYSIASKSAIACPVNWQGKVAGINRLYGGIVISDKPGLWTSSMGVGLPSDLLSGAEGGEIELAASLFAMGDLLVVVTLPTDADGNASAAPRMYWTADGHHWSDVKASYQTIGEEVGLPPMDIDPDNILISIPEVAGINIPVFYDRTNQFFFALARHHGVGGAITGAQWSFIPLNENPIPESDLTTDGDPFLNQAKLDMSYTYNMVVVRNRFPKDKIWILNNLSYTTTIEPDEGYRLSQCVPVDGLGVIVSQYKNEGDSNSGTHHYRVDYYCKDGQFNSALTKRQRLHDSTYDYSNEGQDQYYTTPFRPDITVGRLSESRALLSLCAYGNYGAGLGPHTHLYISREGKGPYEAPTVEVYPDTSGGKFHRGQSYNSDRYSLLTDQGDLIWCTGWDTEYELNRVAWEGRPNELKFDGRAVKTHDPKQIWKL